ncbi:MAG: ABC transporter substrate-binding protein [Desulfobacteraceae bacterium]|nr:ABC transporter substrate-binding protein [Desulfobacteraceae bacterium]
MKKTLFISLLLLAVVLAVLYLPFVTAPLRKEVVRIAVAVPMTGTDEETGKEILRGIKLCLDEINKKGGINDKKIELLIMDDKNQEDAAKKIASEIAGGDPLIVIGHLRNETCLAAGRIYEEKKVPAITASAATDLVTCGNNWYFSVIPANGFQGRFIANYISKVLKTDAASIIYTKDYYGSSLSENFQAEAVKLKLKINANIGFDSSSKNKEDELERIINEIRTMNDPGVLFLATDVSDGAAIAKSLKYPGSNFTVIGPDSFASRSFLAEINSFPQERLMPGYYSNGIYAVSPFIIDIGNEEAQHFRHEFLKAYNQEPGWIAACYYDAMFIALQAVKNAGVTGKPETTGSDRKKIRDWLTSLYNAEKSFKGVTGDIYFDRNGNVVRPPAVGAYKNQALISEPVQYMFISELKRVENIMKNILDGQIIKIDDYVMTKTRLVYTGIDINEISDLDLLNGSYTFDFYLWFRYNGDFDSENIEFVNADNLIDLGAEKNTLRISNDIVRKVLEKKTDGFTTLTYRVRAVFQSDFEFSAYPFDHLILRVQFRHASKTRDELIYVSDVMGMRHFTKDKDEEPGYNALRGWEIDSVSFYQNIVTSDSTLGYPTFFGSKNTIQYSQYNAAVQIKRQVMGFLLKNIFSVVIMLMTLYIIYFIPDEQFELRLSIGMGVLMTNAFLHQEVSSSLQVGYVVAIDYAFFVVYILSTMSVVISMKGNKLHEDGTLEKAHALNIAGRIIQPAFVVAVVLIIVYLYIL